MFVVQKHDASRLHYDLRLEIDGVLVSWALPKGPSLDPSQKRLAVMTEDHPLEYAEFEGTIPEGQYGAGTVMVWDRGTYETPEDVPVSDALREGVLEIVLCGKKLQGRFALVKMRWKGGKNWLLIKKKDDYARGGSDITQEAPDSAATGRSLGEISEGESSH